MLTLIFNNRKKVIVTNTAEIFKKKFFFCLEENYLYLHNTSRENVTFQLALGQLRSLLLEKWSKWSLAQPALCSRLCLDSHNLSSSPLIPLFAMAPDWHVSSSLLEWNIRSLGRTISSKNTCIRSKDRLVTKAQLLTAFHALLQAQAQWAVLHHLPGWHHTCTLQPWGPPLQVATGLTQRQGKVQTLHTFKYLPELYFQSLRGLKK